MNVSIRKFKTIVIGASLGGLEALEKLFSALPTNFSCAIIVVQHLAPEADLQGLINILNKQGLLNIQEAKLNEAILPNRIYLAPPDYHLLIEANQTFTLSLTEKHNYSRPSIDFLFESAADAFTSHLIGIVLTGANSDGAAGLKKIRALGGYAIVQDPKTAYASEMPMAAIDQAGADQVLPLEKISTFLRELALKQGG